MARQWEEISKCPKCGAKLYREYGELVCIVCGFRTLGRKQVCRVCEKEFTARKEQLKRPIVCCSISCALRWQYECERQGGKYNLPLRKRQGHNKLPLTECVWCSILFKPRLSVQRFCSVKCAVSERMNRIKATTLWITQTCFVCNKEFKVKKSQVDAGHGIVCSLKCRGVLGAYVANLNRWGKLESPVIQAQ